MPPNLLIPISTLLSPRRYSTSFGTGSSTTSSSSSSGLDDPFWDDWPSSSSSSSSCNNCTNEGKEWGIVVGCIFGVPIAGFVLFSLLAWILVGWSGLRTKIRARKAARGQRKRREAWARRQAAMTAGVEQQTGRGRGTTEQDSERWFSRKWRAKHPDVEKGLRQPRFQMKETRGKPGGDGGEQNLFLSCVRRLWSKTTERLGWKSADEGDGNAAAANEIPEKAPDISKAEAAVAKPEAVAIAMSGSNLESWNRGHS